MNKIDYTGMQFGNRLIIRNYCIDDDWLSIGKIIPEKRKDQYVLGKCLNCGSIIPTDKRNMKIQPPKRCTFCSNIGNHHQIKTNTNSWVIKNDIGVCNVLFKNQVVNFLVDSDMVDICKQYVWRIAQKRNKYYVVTGSSKKGTMIYLHQMILGKPDDNNEIDHIDGNSLNNTRSNLRYVSHQENVDNIKATRIDNQIGIRGISYDRRGKKYVVDFTYHDKRYYVKPWNTIEEAVWCRRCFEDYFGLELVKNNPLSKLYELENNQLKEEIKSYVYSKIS
jgi:hypothetical protein